MGGWRVCLDPSAHAADYGQEVRVQKVSGRAGCISNSPLVSESCAVPCAFSLLKSTLSRGWSFQDKPGALPVYLLHPMRRDSEGTSGLHAAGKLACGQLSLLDNQGISRNPLVTRGSQEGPRNALPCGPTLHTHSTSIAPTPPHCWVHPGDTHSL